MLKEIVDTIKDNDTIWVMENRENSDRIFTEYVTDKLFSSTYVIVSKGIAYIFVHKLDEENVKVLDKNYSKVYIYETADILKKYFIEVLTKLNFPKNVLLSYTTMSDENTDIISYSCYLRISKLLRRLYKDYGKKALIKSAEMNIYEIISKNSNDDIEKIKLLASFTQEILEKSFRSIKPYQTEIEIANNTIDITNKYMKNVMQKYDIINYGLAWNICPIVLTGINLKNGGHSMPSEKKIIPGDTIYFDFGIQATFKNGKTFYTDIQRMGYLLKNDERKAPKEVEEVFNTLVLSIKKGIKKMKPDIKGYKIDEIVRGEILSKGYPDYPHATGHPVGKQVHAGGALIAPKYSKRAKISLVETGIYTLEPRIDIENGGSIEEMILVTKDGAIPLCNIQEKLYLI